MSDEGIFLSGPPEEVVRAMMARDQISAAMCVVLDEFEADFSGSVEWDTPPVMLVCTRQLPSQELAERIQEEAGATLMGLAVQELGLLPRGMMASLPPQVLMAAMAKAMRQNAADFASTMTEGGIDLIAWVLTYEAWESEVDRDEATGGPVAHVAPSQDPDRKEVRVVMAVDRAGFRYTIRRIRGQDDARVMFVDNGPMDGRGWRSDGTSLMEALMDLMDATPSTA